jgi:ribosome maturation protein Sdo1
MTFCACYMQRKSEPTENRRDVQTKTKQQIISYIPADSINNGSTSNQQFDNMNIAIATSLM